MRCAGASGEGTMPHLERVCEWLITVGRALGRAIEEGDVLDIEPVHGRIPPRGDLADKLVLATRIPFGIADGDGEKLVRTMPEIERVRARGEHGRRIPSAAQPDARVAFAVKTLRRRAREELA